MKVLIFHAAAGYGHKRAAEIVQAALLSRGVPAADVELHDALDFCAPAVKKGYLDFYFNCVKYAPGLWGWFYDFTDHPTVYRIIQPFRRLYNHLIAKGLEAKILTTQPNVIISTHFFAAEVAAYLKTQKKITSRLITIITDFMPHTTWINPGTDTYWVMAQSTQKEVIRRGLPESSVFAKGIPVDPIFKPSGQQDLMLQKHGLQSGRFTILLTSGSFGFAAYEALLRHLEEFKDRIQCFVVCGNNAEAKTRLVNLSFAYPVKCFGFVNFMHELMEASDIMIAKSGGLTTSESLAKGIPMIVTQPIPGQETRNVDFLKAHEASFFIQTPDQAKLIIRNILREPHLIPMKKKAISRIAKPDSAADLADFILNTAASSPKD